MSCFIPAIRHLQKTMPPIPFSSLLGQGVVGPRLAMLQLDPMFLCSDLKSSDLFFNSLKKQ
jgi:hypothetical protein